MPESAPQIGPSSISALNGDSNVLPILKGAETNLKSQIPSVLNEATPTQSPSALFSDYLKTGNPILKQQAGDAYSALSDFASKAKDTANQMVTQGKSMFNDYVDNTKQHLATLNTNLSTPFLTDQQGNKTLNPAYASSLGNMVGGFVGGESGAITGPIKDMMDSGATSVANAFSNSAIGNIDLHLGDSQFGLNKIMSSHPEVLPYIQNAIGDAKVVSQLPGMTVLESQGANPIRFVIDHQLGTDNGIVPKTFLNNAYFKNVPREGVEPTTQGASNLRSTTELPGQSNPNIASSPSILNSSVDNSPPLFQGFQDLSTRLLEQLKGRDTVSNQYISDLTNQADLKQPEKDLIRSTLANYGDTVPVNQFANDVKAQLLPLTQKAEPSTLPRYESVNLPPELRGPVANYKENIYQSPIPTSAGAVHFNSQVYPNYFAHTRVEDLPPSTGELNQIGERFTNWTTKPNYEAGTTRRVLELQSDLFQKGRLENENLQKNRSIGATYSSSEGAARVQSEISARDNELSQLEPYRNNWWQRVIPEEVKQAALDGKTKLQFPTGDTAMKIEGLGERNTWALPENYDFSPNDSTPKLSPEDLKVGREVNEGFGGNRWIITDVLGDGKFKAVKKDTYELHKNGTAGESGDWGSAAETFDISGKVDTNNPIHKFYEKDVSKYLANKYGAKQITDPQGVTWNELNVPQEAKTKPILSYGKTTIPSLFTGAALTGVGVGAAVLNKHLDDLGTTTYNQPDSILHPVNDAIMSRIEAKEGAQANTIHLNKDGTHDYGKMQINSSMLPFVHSEFKKIGKTFNPLNENDSRQAARMILQDNYNKFKKSVGRSPNQSELMSSYNVGVSNAIKQAKEKIQGKAADRYVSASIFHG